MRVAMVGPFGLRPRGTMVGRALPMAQALAARGHQVALFVPPWQNPEDAGRSSIEQGVWVEHVSLPPRIPGLFHLLTACSLVRRVVAFRPDVVHFFKPKAYSGLSHWLMAHWPLYRLAFVVDTDDWEGPGGWNEIGGYSAIQRHFFSWQERWGVTHAHAVTVASRTLESLVWALGVPRARVFYIPNGVPEHMVTPRYVSAHTHARPTILLYTRFFEFPVTRVLELLKRVRLQVPNTRLLVVGQGLKGEERELLNQAHEYGVDEAIEYVGWVEPEELPTHFSQATVAIYPFDDTLINRAKCSLKLVELLAAGIPVIAEAVGQNQEMIRHGETGWLIEPGDIDGFANAVVRLLRDEELRERLSQGAVRRLRNCFTWSKLIVEVERAYTVAVEQAFR